VATLGFVVLAVGAQAPIAFIIAFIPMLFIAAAYQELNREIPDCGTTFTWATKPSDQGSAGWGGGAWLWPASSCSPTWPRSAASTSG
jgi:amino acid transporter